MKGKKDWKLVKGGAFGDKSKAGTGADSGDGKNKKPGDVKSEKTGGKDSKKDVNKSTKDQGKKPPKDLKAQAGKPPANVKMFQHPHALESVTEGTQSKTHLVEQQSITDLHKGPTDKIDDSSSFWEKSSTDATAKLGKGKGLHGKGGKRRGGVFQRGKDKNKQKKTLCGEQLPEDTTQPIKDCPCEICELMTRPEREKDPPFILEMLNEQKHRKTIEYHQRLCHQAYLMWRDPEYFAPCHKCDPIECDDHFTLNPKIADYFDRLTALNNLQKLLCSNHDKADHQLLYLVQNLKDRLCWRLDQFL